MRILAVCDGPGLAKQAGILKERFPAAELVEMSLGPQAAGHAAELLPDMILLDPQARAAAHPQVAFG